MSDSRTANAAGPECDGRGRPDAEPRLDADPQTVPTADGRELVYAEYGDPEGDPVVFLHGTPGSRHLGGLFDRVAKERGVRVLAPDRPGYGQSTHRPGRRPADAIEYVRPILDDAGVSTVGVVAFSGGAADALALGVTSDVTVDRIHLVSGAVPPTVARETPRLQRFLGTAAARAPRLLGVALRGQARLADRLSPSAIVAQYTTDGVDTVPADVARLVRRDFVESCAHSPSGAVTELSWIADGWGVAVDDITVPVRLWHGSRDANVPLADAERLCDRLPGSGLTVFEGTDHLGTLRQSRPQVLDGGD